MRLPKTYPKLFDSLVNEFAPQLCSGTLRVYTKFKKRAFVYLKLPDEVLKDMCVKLLSLYKNRKSQKEKPRGDGYELAPYYPGTRKYDKTSVGAHITIVSTREVRTLGESILEKADRVQGEEFSVHLYEIAKVKPPNWKEADRLFIAKFKATALKTLRVENWKLRTEFPNETQEFHTTIAIKWARV